MVDDVCQVGFGYKIKGSDNYRVKGINGIFTVPKSNVMQEFYGEVKKRADF